MLNVLIMNRQTRDSFLDQPVLYANIVNRKDVELCLWIESGSTLESTLPNLEEIIAPHPKWRAIVVDYQDDGPMEKFTADPENPFDFTDSPFELYQPNPVPLVRLTHFLKGLPPLGKSFVEEEIIDQTGMRKMVLNEIKPDPALERKWQDLADFYDNDLRQPEQIVLIRRRLALKDPSKRHLEKMWSLPEEIESSRFALRNGYAPGCRFVCVDYTRQGRYQTLREAFEFWVGSTILALAEIDGSTLQADRLYQLKVPVDRFRLNQTLQTIQARLNSLKEQTRQESARLLAKHESLDETLPRYQATLPELYLETGSFEESESLALNFPILPERKIEQLDEWQDYLDLVQEEYQASLKKISRSFERAAGRISGKMDVGLDGVVVLNQWQKEDLEEQLQKEMLDWLEISAKLPNEGIVKNKKLQKTDDQVRWLLENQASRTRVVQIAALCGGLLVIGLLMGFWFSIWPRQSGLWLVAWMLITLVLLFGGGLASLLLWNKKARDLADAYRREIEEAADQMNSDTNGFADYLEQAVNLVRGAKYLRLSSQKAKSGAAADQSTLYDNRLQLEMLEELQTKLEQLALANTLSLAKPADLHLETLLDEVDEKNLLLLDEGVYNVEINHSGHQIESPWPFVDRIVIEREELYE